MKKTIVSALVAGAVGFTFLLPHTASATADYSKKEQGANCMACHTKIPSKGNPMLNSAGKCYVEKGYKDLAKCRYIK